LIDWIDALGSTVQNTILNHLYLKVFFFCFFHDEDITQPVQVYVVNVAKKCVV